MKILLTAPLLFIALASFAQKSFGLKVYQNTDIFESQFNNSTTLEVTKVQNTNFTRISMAAEIGARKGYFHEIEIFIPEVSKSFNDLKFPLNYKFRTGESHVGKASSYSLRYELNKALTDDSHKLSFLLGAGINPYYIRIEYGPLVGARGDTYTSTKLYGFALNLTPRIKYKLTERFVVDLNIPLKLYDLRGRTNEVKNPAIPVNRQTTRSHSNIFLESAYTIRLGLMYKLNG